MEQKMEKTRVGIIGTGNISNAHMEGYNTLLDSVELAACCDLDREKAEAFAKRYGFAKVYTDYNEMLANEKLDAVSVCTWNAEHKNAAIAALKAGANVLCEKPMAMNRFEAEEMKKAADDSGRVLMIGFVRRFGKDAELMKTFIDGGTMGDALGVYGTAVLATLIGLLAFGLRRPNAGKRIKKLQRRRSL